MTVADSRPEAEAVRKHLLVDPTEAFEALVQRVKPFLMLDASGGVHFRVKKAAVSDRSLLSLFLLGKHLSHLAGLSKTDVVTLEEIAKACRVSTAVASARLAELKSGGVAETIARGRWRIVSVRLEEVIEGLEKMTKQGI